MVVDPLDLGIPVDQVPHDELFIPSDGKKGGAKRVTKLFGRIDSWAGTVRFHIIDDSITQDVFRETLEYSGLLVGIGRFRPERGGYYGRFEVQKVTWAK